MSCCSPRDLAGPQPHFPLSAPGLVLSHTGLLTSLSGSACSQPQLTFPPLLFLPTAETPSHTSSGPCSDRPHPPHCPVLLSPQHVSSPEIVGLVCSSMFLSLPHSSVKALRPGASVSFTALNPSPRGSAWPGPGHWGIQVTDVALTRCGVSYVRLRPS